MAGSDAIVVVGAGIAGLMTALALKRYPGQVTVVERDPEPAVGVAPQDAFVKWRRPGVPHFRHSHMLLSRLRTTIRDHHPELLAELGEVGVHASTLDSMLPPTHAQNYVPAEGDDDLVHLWGRRATFEAVVRRHLQRYPHIRFLHDTKVRRVVLRACADAREVSGVEISGPTGCRTLDARCLVDASGKHGEMLKLLQAQGLSVREERVPVGFAYFCRHYALQQPCQAPRRGTGGILDYLWFGTFFAEGNQFSVAMACPEEERGLGDFIRRAEGFERVCAELPALQVWLKSSVPVSPVLGAGKLTNQWRELSADGPGTIHGLYAVGDALIQTNPMYGRGCSAAAVQGHLLADVLQSELPRAQRLAEFQMRVREQLRPYYNLSVTADRMFAARGRMARGESVPWADRALSWVHESIVDPAAMADLEVGRELVRGMQMREASPLRRQVRVLGRALWATAARPFVTPHPQYEMGPARDLLFARLGIDRPNLQVLQGDPVKWRR